MEMKRASHSVYELGYHIIWCTKYSHPVLVDAVEIVCRRTIAEVCREYGWTLHEIDAMPDHVHAFIEADPSVAPSQIARTCKSISAVAIFTRFPKLKGQKFWGSGLWSPSTYYGSVGHVSEDTVRRYIQDQKVRACTFWSSS